MRKNTKTTHIVNRSSKVLKIKKRPKKQKAVSTINKQQPEKLKVKIPRTPKQYSELSETAKENWGRAAQVISKMRTNKTSLTKTAKEFNVKPTLVIDLAKSALKKQKNGRYVATKTDKLLRVLVIPSPEGLTEVAVRGSSTASKIGEYSDAVQKYLRTGDASRLRKFSKLKLRDASGKPIQLVLDIHELKRLGSAGVLSFESLYARVA